MNQLPKDIEDIIIDYKQQLEHTEKYKWVMMDIECICYRIDRQENSSSYIVNIPHKVEYRKFQLTICKVCNKYYRSNIIIYKKHKSFVMRYSYYNTFLEGDLDNEYVIHYGGQSVDWESYYKNKPYNKYINCNCLENIF